MAKPLCPYFGKCGGCSFQDVDYAEQLESKKQRIIEAVDVEDIRVFSGREYFYRHRMDMVFHEGGLGFKERGAWYNIVDVERCVISNEKLNEYIGEIRAFFSGVDVFHVKKKVGTFRFAVIRTPPTDSSISIVLNQESSRLDKAEEKIKEFAKTTSAYNVLMTFVPPNRGVSVSEEYSVIKGREMLKEEYVGKKFWYPTQGFFQNNHDVAEKMHIYINGLLREYETQDAHLLDLYGGVGAFALVNSSLFKDVMIVENSEMAINAATRNIEENQATNINPLLQDSKRLKDVELGMPLFVVVDPPRSGIHPKAVKRLNELRPEVIIYVSCNVNQLRDDLEKLKGYRIKTAAFFDLFPQTPHIETVAELILRE